MVLLASNYLVVGISVQCEEMKKGNATQDRYDDDDDNKDDDDDDEDEDRCDELLMMMTPPPILFLPICPRSTFSKATHLKRKRNN